MKRSTKIKLSLMAIPVGALLVGCGDPEPEEVVFSSIEECKSSGLVDATVCETSFKDALAEHNKTAPRFMSLAECEAEYGVGKCLDPQGNPAQASSSGSWFMPAMMGFMTSQLLNSALQGSRDYDRSYRSYRSKPLYKHSGSGSWRTARSENVGYGTGKIRTEDSKWKSERSETYKRGGFGSKASARGSWGS
jgi:uncharacterized protein YgiB involved in biofilm formation